MDRLNQLKTSAQWIEAGQHFMPDIKILTEIVLLSFEEMTSNDAAMFICAC